MPSINPYANGAWRTLADMQARISGAWKGIDKIWVARNVLVQPDPPIWETEWIPLITLRVPPPGNDHYVINPSVNLQGFDPQEVMALWTPQAPGHPYYEYAVEVQFYQGGVHQFTHTVAQTAGSLGWYTWPGGQAEGRFRYATAGGYGPQTTVYS